MTYTEHRKQLQKDISDFPLFFAFSQEQFNDGLKKLGVSEDEVLSTSVGACIRKKDEQAYIDMFKNSSKRLQALVDADRYGSNFVKGMFLYEMVNHEYGYTYELEDTLNALGFSYDDIENNPALKNGLNLAIEKYQNSEVE